MPKAEGKSYYIWSWIGHTMLLAVLVLDLPFWCRAFAFATLTVVNALEQYGLWFNRSWNKELFERLYHAKN